MVTWSSGYIRNCFKDSVGWIFMVAVVIAFILLVIINAISPNRFASVEKNDRIDTILDTRCICICPHNLNLTLHHNKTVFIQEIRDPGLCTCHNVIHDASQLECLQCQCTYESRNALLIATSASLSSLTRIRCSNQEEEEVEGIGETTT